MRRGEVALYFALLLLLQGAYLLGAAGYPNPSLGLNQLGHLGLPKAAATLAAVWIVALGFTAVSFRFRPGFRWRIPPWLGVALSVLAAAASVWAFLTFVNHYINRDGLNLFAKIRNGVAERGSFVTHDEMLELYLHSRLYAWANQAFGWSVGRCYQVASAAAGGAFVLLLLLAAPRWAPRGRIAFAALILSCGFVQLFFGDVENYSWVTVWILAYLLAAEACLNRGVPLWAPSLCLSLAMGFHMLAGWLLPSLGYLFLHCRKEGRGRELPAGAVAWVLPIAWLLVFFHFSGLPIQRLWQSSHLSGMGGHYGKELAPLDLAYHWGILNALLLLWPTAVLLPALAAFRRPGADPLSRFLWIAAGAMIVFTFVWRAELGLPEDWNLYAPGMVPPAMLTARGLCRLPGSAARTLLLTALALTAAAHTYTWVLSNHFLWR
jgi:hypothetical protein